MIKKIKNKSSQTSSKPKSYYSILLFAVMLLEQICAFCPRVIFLSSYLPIMSNIAIALICILVLARLLVQKRTFRELIIVIALLLIALLSYLSTGSMILFFLITMPLLAEGAEFKQVIKADLIIKISITAFIIFCYKNGLTQEYTYFRDGAIRESLGFTHPNKLGYMALMIYLNSYYLLPKNNKSITKRLLIAIIPLFLCVLADSRTALYAILAITVLSIIDKIFTKLFKIKKKNIAKNLSQKAIYILPIALVFASLASSFLYKQGNETMYKLNDSLSGRIALQNYYDNHYSYSLLGTAIDSEVLETNPLDNGYYRVLYMNGVAGIVALLIIAKKCLKKADGDKRLTVFLVTLLLYGLSEWMIFRLTITPFWMIAFEKSKKNEE